MIRTIIIAATLTAVVLAQAPSQQCLSSIGRRNHKDLYEDPSDCHQYLQCFYVNSTFAVGFQRQCPQGQFWHDPVLSCMPEGETPCVDRCLSEDATSARGCYAGTGCRQYFQCSNTGSYGMCCPETTQFDEDTCSCVESTTCADDCQQVAPLVPTSVAPATQVNSTVCQDSFGSLIALVTLEENAYWLLDSEGLATEKQYCPTGVSFDITSCRCNTENGATQPPTITKRQATVYLTFDDNTSDNSFNNFATFLFDGAQRDTTVAARGAGSLAVNGGYLSLPGLKTLDMRGQASYCAFYRGSGAGGILSNNKNADTTDFTVVFGAESSTSFVGKLNFWHPVGTQTVTSTLPEDSWNHFCATYNGNMIRLYINGAIADSQFVGGYLSLAHSPFVVGTDQAMGTYDGHIDEVLITPFAMTRDEVELHRAGDQQALRDLGFF